MNQSKFQEIASEKNLPYLEFDEQHLSHLFLYHLLKIMMTIWATGI